MTKKKKSAKKKGRRVFKLVLLSILLLILLASVAFGGILLAMVKTTPSLDVNQIFALSETSKLYDDKDKFMDNILTEEKSSPVKINEIPLNLKNAFISIEDERFYEHKGIDPKRIMGAVLSNIKNKLTGNKNLQGASTITQQLIKNSMLTPEVKLKRKVQEIYLAMQLENSISKDRILEAYLNTIYLGRGARGVGAASEQYFSKNVKDLNLIESAYIAGVTQSPSIYDAFSPTSKKNPSIYLNRTKTVLSKMHENGKINNEQYTTAIKDIDKGNLKFNPSNNSHKMQYEWFSREVIKQVKNDLKSTHGYTDNEVNKLLMQGGLKIYTTMDKNLQDNTQNVINDMNKLLNIRSITKNNISQLQAAAVLMDYHKGEVKAIVGGKGEQPAMSTNRATSQLNPCGSSIKPISVYAPAIDTKLLTGASVLNDNHLPKEFKDKYQNWDPKNSPNSYSGPISLRTGLKYSKNTIAAQVEDVIGLKTGASYAEKFGLNLTARDKSSIAALSLGEIEGTTPMVMAAAYGVFGNDGLYTEPKTYRKVVDRNGKVLLENKAQTKKVISPATAYIMYDLLKEPLTTWGTKANFGAMARGKTGTTTAAKDLWFAGLTPYYSSAVWIGDDKNTVINDLRLGRNLNSNDAALLWGRIMKYAHNDLPFKNIQKPSGVQEVTVCSASGKIVGPYCLKEGKTFTELFLNGTAPTEFCDVHKAEIKKPEEDTNKDKDKDKDKNKDKDKDKNKDKNKNENSTDKPSTPGQDTTPPPNPSGDGGHDE
ncbi:transglycosylase domain-containing protein [Haloimpatiens massiliensis]|uniref:transglycosylase domain-containing protein n=1 Tax=Haloimpatiens massiliensis TaxID=1658110 RepID=UPI000C84BE00|nr:PBP1A family penicillin-binding protein [Haloimpatiens massiliensis]